MPHAHTCYPRNRGKAGFGRRVEIVEKDAGEVMSTKRFVWCGKQLCEERDSSGGAVAKRFFADGAQISFAKFYYTRDHLGSVREMSTSTGTLLARYDYDPYGRMTQVYGSLASDFRYTGHYYHAPSGLHLALYRAYDADTGRWLNRDPIEEEGGFNLYGYVGGDPVNYVDLLGLRGYPDDFIGPLQPGDARGRYLPNPDYKPNGWNESWSTGEDSRGPFSQDPNTGEKWYPHDEDLNHWPHYDSDKGNRYPEKCNKPQLNRKRPPSPKQSPNNPWPTQPKPVPPSPPKVPWWQYPVAIGAGILSAVGALGGLWVMPGQYPTGDGGG